jgi:hypothetical protein
MPPLDVDADRDRDQTADARKFGVGDPRPRVAQDPRPRRGRDVMRERVTGLGAAVLGCRLDPHREIRDREVRILGERYEDDIGIGFVEKIPIFRGRASRQSTSTMRPASNLNLPMAKAKGFWG